MSNLQYNEKLELDDEKLLLGKKRNYTTNNNKFFKKFFNITSNLKDSIAKKYPSLNIKVSNKALLEQHMDQFLKLKNEALIFELLDNGYKLTTKQKLKYDEYLYKMEHSYGQATILQLLEKTLGYNIELSPYFKNMFFKESLGFCKGKYGDFTYKHSLDFNSIFNEDYVMQIIDNHKEYKFPLFTEDMRKYIISGKAFKEELDNVFNSLESELKEGSRGDYKYVRELRFLLTGKYHEYFQPHLDYNRLNKLEKKFEKSNLSIERDFKDLLSHLLTINFDKNKQVLKLETKKEYKENYIENHPTHKIINNNAVKVQLPLESINILKKTEEIYFNFSEEFKNLDFECKNLFENKIPQILEQYLSVDEKLRKSLTHMNDKNADALLLESLVNIYNHMDKKWKTINEEKLKDLNISVRYTNNFKK